MNNLPSGNLTFLFSNADDIAKLALEFPDKISAAQKKLHEIIQEAVSINNGHIFKKAGDDYCCSFEKAADAAKAAIQIQRDLNSEDPKEILLSSRIGIHSGTAEWKGDDYKGYVTLARTNRIMSAGSPGQVLISNVTYELVRFDLPESVTFRDLGERILKDLQEPLRLFQLNARGLISEFTPLKTLDARPNNLPVGLTNFIGREKEMKELKIMLNTSRLITLLGTGGTGKSRLAIQIGAEKIDEYENGVRLIELASLRDPELLYNTIASVLNLKEDGSDDSGDKIINYLKEKKILLIFDNCEHMIIQCAEICKNILNKCPGVNILTTSREVLGVEGEMIYQVPTLSMPGPEDGQTAESICHFESIQLFTERAVALKNDFVLSDGNASDIAKICYHLDGIPLAIELAAARVKILKPEKILENISNRFRFLTGGSRISLPRQQTLKAMIDWSFDLLSENEKILFRNLSVFTGGWSLEAAEEVCVTEGIDMYEVLDLISNLSNKSLIISKEINGNIRYNMLETIYEYSLEKLNSDKEIYKRHFEYFLKLSDSDEKNGNDEQENEWGKDMETESGNLRAAVKWSLENSYEKSAKLIINAAEYWEGKGNYSFALEAIKKIIQPDADPEDDEIAAVFINAAFLACQLDDNNNSEKYILKALEYFRRTENKTKTADALSIYGMLSFVKGEPENAKKHYEESLSLLKDTDNLQLLSNVKNNLATLYSATGEMETSLKLLDEVVEIQRNFNKKNLLAKTLVSKGGAYYQNGDLEEARECYMESLSLLEYFDDHYSTATVLYNLGNLNFALMNYPVALDYYQKAMKVAAEYGLKGVLDRSKIKLGEIFLMQNENAKAKKIFIECLLSFSKDSERLKLNLCIYGLGKYYFYEKEYESAVKLFYITERISEQIGFKFSKSRKDENNSIMDEIKSNLSSDKLDEIHKEVMTYDLDKAGEISIDLAKEE